MMLGCKYLCKEFYNKVPYSRTQEINRLLPEQISEDILRVL